MRTHRQSGRQAKAKDSALMFASHFSARRLVCACRAAMASRVLEWGHHPFDLKSNDLNGSTKCFSLSLCIICYTLAVLLSYFDSTCPMMVKECCTRKRTNHVQLRIRHTKRSYRNLRGCHAYWTFTQFSEKMIFCYHMTNSLILFTRASSLSTSNTRLCCHTRSVTNFSGICCTMHSVWNEPDKNLLQ